MKCVAIQSRATEERLCDDLHMYVYWEVASSVEEHEAEQYRPIGSGTSEVKVTVTKSNIDVTRSLPIGRGGEPQFSDSITLCLFEPREYVSFIKPFVRLYRIRTIRFFV